MTNELTAAAAYAAPDPELAAYQRAVELAKAQIAALQQRAEQAEKRERAVGADMVAIVNAAAAYLGAMTWSPASDPKWKPGDGIIDYKTPEKRLQKLLKGPGRPGATLLAEKDATIADLRKDRDAAREVLCEMVNQYMGYKEDYISHEFMSAQEDAIEYLETIGWLESRELEHYYWTPASGRAKARA